MASAALAILLMTIVLLSARGCSQHISLTLWCGTLATAKDQYLDGSGRIFQSCSWHLGNATRSWGETYGLKLDRFYLSLSVRHTNPAVSSEEANE